MKRIILPILLLFWCSSIVSGQTKKTETPKTKPAEQAAPPTEATAAKDSIPLEVAIYTNATYFYDYDVAKYALYGLISKYPERIDYVDSLAKIYFSLGAYPQSIAAANIVLQKQPDNLALIELSAVAQNALNNHKESLAMYEKLYGYSKKIDHLYKIAVEQYSLQRYGECQASIQKILADTIGSAKKITFSYDEKTRQEVPYSAAAYNLRGVMEKELSQKDLAKADFEAALKIFPEFELAKNNLTQLNAPPTAEKDKNKKK